MMLGQQKTHFLEKVKSDPFLPVYTRVDSKWTGDLNLEKGGKETQNNRRKQADLFYNQSAENDFSNFSQNPDAIKENIDKFKKTHRHTVKYEFTHLPGKERRETAGAHEREAWA